MGQSSRFQLSEPFQHRNQLRRHHSCPLPLLFERTCDQTRLLDFLCFPVPTTLSLKGHMSGLNSRSINSSVSFRSPLCQTVVLGSERLRLSFLVTRDESSKTTHNSTILLNSNFLYRQFYKVEGIIKNVFNIYSEN